MDYRPVIPGKHAKPAPEKHSTESRYWRSFKSPVFVKEYAPVTSVHFALSKPHRYAVTAAARVHIYAPRTQKIAKTIARFKDVARSGFIRDDGKLLVAGDDSGLIQVSHCRRLLASTPSHMARSLTLTPEQFSALLMLISSRCTLQSSQDWITHRCFHALMTPLYVCGTCPHSRPLLPSRLTPTTSAPAKFPLLIHTSSSPARTMAPFASLILAQVNVSFSWARQRAGLVLAPCPSSKYSCTHRGPLPCLLRGPSSAYGTSLRVGGVFVRYQTTRRQSRLSPSTPTRRGY